MNIALAMPGRWRPISTADLAAMSMWEPKDASAVRLITRACAGMRARVCQVLAREAHQALSSSRACLRRMKDMHQVPVHEADQASAAGLITQVCVCALAGLQAWVCTHRCHAVRSARCLQPTAYRRCIKPCPKFCASLSLSSSVRLRLPSHGAQRAGA